MFNFIFYLYIGSLIMSIVLLIIFGIWKKTVYWNMFFGIIISRFASIYPIVYYVLLGEAILDIDVDFGGVVALYILFVISVINSVILLIIGLIIRKKITKNNPNNPIRINKVFPITIVIYALMCLLLIVLIPKYVENQTKKPISNNVIIYLEKKYGVDSFKIKRVENDYSYNGIVQKYHTGYEVYVTSDLINKGEEFEIYTDLDGNVKDGGFCYKSFLTKYYYEKYGYKYNKKSRNYVSSDSPLELEVDICTYKIPSTFGKIPTFDEIIEFDALEWFYIYLPEDEAVKYKDENVDRISYVGKETAALIKKFNINKPMKFDFIGIGLFRYEIQKEGEILIITDYNTSDEYKYNIKTMEIIKDENILTN